MNFPHVASRAFDRPLLLQARTGITILGTLARLIARSDDLALSRALPRADDDRAPAHRWASLPLGLARVEINKSFAQVENVAVIEVDGTLVNKNGTLGPDCGMTGYDGIRTQLTEALQDPSIAALALYIDSPGGEVAGCFDLAQFILEARAIKPIVAIVDGMACSAAYALASACTHITCSSVGLLGSIGVIVAHLDISRQLENAGVTVNLIYAGSHKADGWPSVPLSAEVKADIQAEVDSIWTQFAALVAQGRGLSAATVKGFEAQSYLAPEALKRKLCDAVIAPDKAQAALVESVS